MIIFFYLKFISNYTGIADRSLRVMIIFSKFLSFVNIEYDNEIEYEYR